MIERTNLIFLITLLTLNYGLSQEQQIDSLYIYEIADTGPEPIGGMESVYEWFSKQSHWTRFDQTDTLDCSTFRGGRVIVSFTVMKNGKLSDIKIAYGLGEPYDGHCLDLVKHLPTVWQPGTKDGLPVNVKSALPFSFCRGELTEPEQKKRRKKN